MALIKGKQLANGAISTNKIADSSITTDKIIGNAVTPAKIDLTGTFDFSGGVITVATPTANGHAVTKSYVDSVAGTGLEVKESVRCLDASSEFDGWTYNSGSKTLTSANTDTLGSVDGVSLNLNDRILVQGQTTQSENGIYTLTQEGNGSTVPYQLTRATDFDTSGEISANNFFFVEEGTSYADTGWVLTANETITLDTTSLTFQQFSGVGQIEAGNGITKSGNTLSVDIVSSNSGLSASASGLTIDQAQFPVGSISTASTPRYFGFDGTNNSQFSIGTILDVSLPTSNGFLGSNGVYSLRLGNSLELSSGLHQVKIDGNSLSADANGLSVQLNTENSVVETSTGLTAPIMRTDRLGLTPSAVSSSTGSTGQAIPSGITIPSGSAVSVFVNGIKANLGATTSSQCFFSSDGGSTAKALNSIVAADVLYWNPAATGSYDLETSDILDIYYSSVTA